MININIVEVVTDKYYTNIPRSFAGEIAKLYKQILNNPTNWTTESTLTDFTNSDITWI
jgi:hypothetical protein